MSRIISDTYEKGEKRIWDLDTDNPTNQEFNRKIIAVNNMYGWLYEKGILRDVSFEFKDYSDVSFFALDVKDLEPYREQMEQCGVKDALLAVKHIFDEEYTPCLYSGAIQLGWTMRTYRDVDGCVGRSWETGIIQHLNSSVVHDILAIRNEKLLGVRAAVSQAFELSGFEPDLFDKACEYYQELIRFQGSGRAWKNTVRISLNCCMKIQVLKLKILNSVHLFPALLVSIWILCLKRIIGLYSCGVMKNQQGIRFISGKGFR